MIGRRGMSAILVSVVSLAAVSPADAAVRFCRPRITGDIAIADSEKVARKKALDSWIAKSAVAGISAASWRIASAKVLTCKPAGPGKVQCVASAEPCIISQVPGRPLGGRGQLIET